MQILFFYVYGLTKKIDNKNYSCLYSEEKDKMVSGKEVVIPIMNLFVRYKSYILLIIVVLCMTTACNTKESEYTIQFDSQSGQKTDEQAQADYTFSLYSFDSSPNWNDMQDEVGQEIIEKTGVKLDMEFVLNDSEQRLALMTLSKEYPDFIMPKGDANMLVEAEALVDLAPLIDQYGPNLKKVYGKYMNRLRWSEEDPSIYILPNLFRVGQEQSDAGGTFALQHAVVKELNYPAIRTLKDYEEAIKNYIQLHPTINGEPTIGLSLIADDWHFMISVTNPAFFATGAPDDGEFYIDPDTHEALLHYKRPEEKEYFRWLNHMNDIGLLDQESFVQKYDQYLAKIASGRVLGLIDQQYEYKNSEDELLVKGLPERTYGIYPVTLHEGIKDASFLDTGFVAGWGIGITTNCEDPVQAIKFLDWLASEEGQVMINWGIEGKHYVVEDGIRKIPEPVMNRKNQDPNTFMRETGIGLYNISAQYGDGVKDSTGNYYTTNYPEQIISSYSPIEKEVLNAYGVNMWKDLFPKKEEFKQNPWGAAWNLSIPSDSSANQIMQRVNTIVRARIPELILINPDQYDLLWDQFIQELNDAGAEQLELEYSKLIQQRVRLWNES